MTTALRKNGHTVGFLGDGINDAPAMKVADIGISVDTAVDIAKESADVILLEKDLTILKEAFFLEEKLWKHHENISRQQQVLILAICFPY